MPFLSDSPRIFRSRMLMPGGVNVETLSGTKTLDSKSSHYQLLDPGGASRTVTLDSALAVTGNGGWYVFFNAADAPNEILTISDGAAVAYVYPGETAIVVSDGADWYRMGPAQSRTVYQSTAASTAITGATETDTAFSTKGSIPANTLRPGSRIRVRAQGIHTATTGAEDHTIALKVGGVTVASFAAVDPADNDIFVFDVDVLIRTIGATGTMVATGWALGSGASGTGTAKAVFLASTTIDTTAALEVAVYIDRQATATDSDSARLDVISVDVTGMAA